MQVWVEADDEKMLNSPYVKISTDTLWDQALKYIKIQACFYIMIVLIVSLHIGYV